MRQLIITILCLPIMFYSCVEDELPGTLHDAGIRAQFIPADSIVSLQIQLAQISDGQESTQDLLDQIDSLQNAGDPTDFTKDIVELNEVLDSLKQTKTDITEEVGDLKAGNIQLTYIRAMNTNEELTFSIPRTIYRLPLNTKDTSTDFLIAYGGKEYETKFNYSLETIYKEQAVKLQANKLQLISHTFDSVRVTCDSINCTSDEIFVVFYF